MLGAQPGLPLLWEPLRTSRAVGIPGSSLTCCTTSQPQALFDDVNVQLSPGLRVEREREGGPSWPPAQLCWIVSARALGTGCASPLHVPRAGPCRAGHRRARLGCRLPCQELVAGIWGIQTNMYFSVMNY